MFLASITEYGVLGDFLLMLSIAICAAGLLGAVWLLLKGLEGSEDKKP